MTQAIDFEIKDHLGEKLHFEAVSKNAKNYIKEYGIMYKYRRFEVNSDYMIFKYNSGRERDTIIGEFVFELFDNSMAASFTF